MSEHSTTESVWLLVIDHKFNYELHKWTPMVVLVITIATEILTAIAVLRKRWGKQDFKFF